MLGYAAEVLGGLVAGRAWFYIKAGLLLSVVPVAVFVTFFAPMEAIHDATHSVRHSYTFLACH